MSALDPSRLLVSRRSLAELMLAPQRLRLQFQPIADLTCGEVAGYEALARFDVEPHRGPDAWFAASGGQGRLDELAVVRALPAGRFLAVNVTPAALLTELVQRAFAQAGDLHGVVVELAAPAVGVNAAALAAALGPLRAAGAGVAVDDAGAAAARLREGRPRRGRGRRSGPGEGARRRRARRARQARGRAGRRRGRRAPRG